MMSRIAGIVLARMDSSRFPQKALTPLSGVPLLQHCITGVFNTGSFLPILATTNRNVDNPLAEYAQRHGILCFRGELDNIYKRVCDCLRTYEVDIFARINGDSPFVQADLLNRGLDLLKKDKCDFVTNLVPRRFPYGVSVEIFRSKTFLNTENELSLPEHKEHITSYFYQNMNNLKTETIVCDKDLSYIRLTIDTYGDLEFINRMLNRDARLFSLNLSKVIDIYHETLLNI